MIISASVSLVCLIIACVLYEKCCHYSAPVNPQAPGIIDSTKNWDQNDSDVPKKDESEFDDVPQTDPDAS